MKRYLEVKENIGLKLKLLKVPKLHVFQYFKQNIVSMTKTLIKQAKCSYIKSSFGKSFFLNKIDVEENNKRPL